MSILKQDAVNTSIVNDPHTSGLVELVQMTYSVILSKLYSLEAS